MAGIFKKNLFVGYSSIGAPKSQQLVDLALVKQDLLNHFNTRKNERVMMPGWGCGVWEYLFEPYDEATKDAVVLEVQQVIDSDPRVTLQSVRVTELDHGIRVDMVLNYTPLNAAAAFSVNFDRRSVTMT
jgi:phage baseplate assembly protein W